MVLDNFMKFQTFINHFFLVLNNHSLLVHFLFNDHHLLAFLYFNIQSFLCKMSYQTILVYLIVKLNSLKKYFELMQ